MKKTRLILPAALACLIAAAALAGCAGNEKAEEATADITAAQMMGRNSARDILTRNWKDTALLMKEISMARSQKCRFDTTGHPECGAAFDTAFIRTLRAVDPRLEKLASRP